MTLLTLSCNQSTKNSSHEEVQDKAVIGYRSIPGIDTFYNIISGEEYYTKYGKLYPDSFGMIEVVCDEENQFIYSKQEIKRRIANNYGNYLVRHAERDLDTIVNYRHICFIKDK